jgi:hypothetical protein
MLTDLKRWKSDAGDALPVAVGALGCSALSLVCCTLSGVSALFVPGAVLLILAALALAACAHGQDPLGWGGAVVIGAVIGSVVACVAILMFR